MFTNEQIMKAKACLLPSVKELEKSFALCQHKKASTGMELYGLPYRVYLDYLREWDKKSNEEKQTTVCINPCYPLNGYPKDKVKVVTIDDLAPVQTDERGYGIKLPFEDITTLKPETQREIEYIIKPLEQWEVWGENWDKYFYHFLIGYDFESFTEFDFTGTSGKELIEDISLLRKAYKRYQDEYNANPDKYMNTEPHTTPQEKEKYTDVPYIVDFGNGTETNDNDFI